MITFIKNLILRYYYVGAFAAFILLFVLGLDSTKPQPVTDQHTAELTNSVQNWQKNASELNNYLLSRQLESDSLNKRYQHFNLFSNLNNQNLQKTLSTAQSLNDKSIYNSIAKLSKDYALFFDLVKSKIENNTTDQNQKKLAIQNQFQILQKGSEHVQDTIDQKYQKKQSNYKNTYFLLSLISLISSALHLFILLNISKRNNWNLSTELETFKKALGNVGEGVVVTNKYGFFTFINDSAKKILGPAVNDIYYPSSIDIMGFHDLSGRKLIKEEIPMHTALHRHIILDQEILVKNSEHKKGIIVSCSNGYFVDDRGQTTGSVVVLKNITAKKQIEELWKTEKERALKNSQLKSDFLASMSHEIRTPMNGVLGLTDLLKQTKLNDEQKDYVLTIQRSAKALLNLINDILDHSKIEAGKLDIHLKPFSVTKIVKDVCDNFKPLILEKNIQLKTDLQALDHDYYISDPHRLRQILINLVGNAIKFTHKGHVQINVSYSLSNNLVFSVQDTGPGMSEQEVNHLFEKYFQTKNGQTMGGTGLGLSICQQLVKLLKGQIGVSSQPGEGSQFWFTVPCDKANLDLNNPYEDEKMNLDSDDQRNIFEQKYSGLILVAEDNSINQKVITNYLNQLGLRSIVAENGLQAVKLFQQHKPDLILMDSNMPQMNGLESTIKIISLQKNQNQHPCPVVMLSADVRPETINESLSAGAKAFLSKPIDIEELILILKKYLPFNHKVNYESPVQPNNKPISHIEKIKDHIVGDQLLIEILLADFKQQANQGLVFMEKLLHLANYQEIYHISHNLKSAAAELDALSFADLMQKIEDLSLSYLNEKNEDKTKILDNMKNTVQQASAILNEELIHIENKIKSIKDQKRQAS